jgi:hypothetical protein
MESFGTDETVSVKSLADRTADESELALCSWPVPSDVPVPFGIGRELCLSVFFNNFLSFFERYCCSIFDQRNSTGEFLTIKFYYARANTLDINRVRSLAILLMVIIN